MTAPSRRADGVTRALSPAARFCVGALAVAMLLGAAFVIFRAAGEGPERVPGGWGTLIAAVVTAAFAVRALRAAIRGTITVRRR